MVGMKITVSFDTSILTPVAVVTKEPKNQCIMTQLQIFLKFQTFYNLLDSQKRDHKS